MSNPLKRVLDPVEEVDDATFNGSTGAMPGVDPHRPYQQEVWQRCDEYPDAPRHSQYHGPSYVDLRRYGKNTGHSLRALLTGPAAFPPCN